MHETQNKQPAIFFDRDGTLTDDKNGYLFRAEDCELLPGAIEGLQLLAPHYQFFIITNQSGIGRGYFDEFQFWEFQNRCHELLAEAEIEIKDVAFCPHSPEDGCACRKPSAQLIEGLVATYNIDVTQSWIVGDKSSDVEAGKNARMQTALLTTRLSDLSSCRPDIAAATLPEVAEQILRFRR